MIDETRKKEIEDVAIEINTFSEKYQLIHATVAVEKLYRIKMQENISRQYDELRNKMQEETDSDKLNDLYDKVKEIKEESNKKINISIEFSDHISKNSARTTRTINNNFLISLPKSMSEFRDEFGKLDFDRLDALRRLMAHELGHIVLDSGIFGVKRPAQEVKEEESNYFADKLIELRKKHSDELSNRVCV